MLNRREYQELEIKFRIDSAARLYHIIQITFTDKENFNKA